MKGGTIKVLNVTKEKDDAACADKCEQDENCHIYAYGRKEISFDLTAFEPDEPKPPDDSSDDSDDESDDDDDDESDNSDSSDYGRLRAESDQRSILGKISPWSPFCKRNTSVWNCINAIDCFWCTTAMYDQKSDNQDWCHACIKGGYI